ncbi:hypothetical protein F4678DRAFT_402962 [Xylaria arbuscula]|nr:hypothetical protein F4678DRAFT_402962 [Xylaria arbuscula]
MFFMIGAQVLRIFFHFSSTPPSASAIPDWGCAMRPWRELRQRPEHLRGNERGRSVSDKGSCSLPLSLISFFSSPPS